MVAMHLYWIGALLAGNTEHGFDTSCSMLVLEGTVFSAGGPLFLSFGFVCTVLTDWGPRR